jgi:hypothetical protein
MLGRDPRRVKVVARQRSFGGSVRDIAPRVPPLGPRPVKFLTADALKPPREVAEM